jgi:hypothetical protein
MHRWEGCQSSMFNVTEQAVPFICEKRGLSPLFAKKGGCPLFLLRGSPQAVDVDRTGLMRERQVDRMFGQ